MTLQEQISRMKSIMGLLIEDKNEEKVSPAPWGIIFDGDDKILVGDMHQTPVELSKEYEDKVVKVANEYGYWGEGIGLKHNKAITDSNFYQKLDPKKELGSWDLDGVIESKLTSEEKRYFLYALFSNIKENYRLERLVNVAKEGEKIIDVLNKTIPDWSADGGKLNLGGQDVEYFLKKSSESNGVDLLKMAKENDATEENIKDFLETGESLQWPENWKEYPNAAGRFARVATMLRDRYLINAGPGVYFVGAGHLKDIVEMPEGIDKGLELIGGEKI